MLLDGRLGGLVVAGVLGSCEMPETDARTELRASAEAASACDR